MNFLPIYKWSARHHHHHPADEWKSNILFGSAALKGAAGSGDTFLSFSVSAGEKLNAGQLDRHAVTLSLLLQVTRAPGRLTETCYDVTSGREETCWPGNAGPRRTGERRAFKTVWTERTKLQRLLWFYLPLLFNPREHRLIKMHVGVCFPSGCTCCGLPQALGSRSDRRSVSPVRSSWTLLCVCVTWFNVCSPSFTDNLWLLKVCNVFIQTEM